MKIERLIQDKRKHLGLLLLADEQECMIDRYLDRGECFLLSDLGCRRAIAVVTEEGGGVCELKNLAVEAAFQRQGYGRALVGWLAGHYRGRDRTMLVGTGETPSILAFYQSCGFLPSHRIPRFFTDHYDHPIIEEGVLLTDMVVLSMPLASAPTVIFQEESL